MFFRLNRKGLWRRKGRESVWPDGLQNKVKTDLRRKLQINDIRLIIINVVWSSNPIQTGSVANPAFTPVGTLVL
jgi:hypothetical protein